MQFKVPQFLDIEDKIFGPFTFREFVYLVGGGGLCFVIYKLIGLLWGIIPIILVGGFAGMLTFYRPNNKPFIYMLEAGFKYAFQDKLYIWKRRRKSTETKAQERMAAETKTQMLKQGTNYPGITEPRLGGSKLKDLAWSLDVLDTKKEEK